MTNRSAVLDQVPDNGCEAGGPSCVACRLPVCVEDADPVDAQAERDRVLTARYDALSAGPRRRGVNVAAIVAEETGVSKRTVDRAVARRRKERGA